MYNKITLAGVGIVVSLVLGVANLIFSLSTFEPTHRPYIGISEAWIERAGQSLKDELVWVVRIKNVGSIPATVRVTKIDYAIPLPANRFNVAGGSELENRYYILPNATVLLSEKYISNAGPASVEEILNSSVPFRVHLELSYENKGFLWLAKHTYSAELKVAGGVREPSLTFVTAEGD